MSAELFSTFAALQRKPEKVTTQEMEYFRSDAHLRMRGLGPQSVYLGPRRPWQDDPGRLPGGLQRSHLGQISGETQIPRFKVSSK